MVRSTLETLWSVLWRAVTAVTLVALFGCGSPGGGQPATPAASPTPGISASAEDSVQGPTAVPGRTTTPEPINPVTLLPSGACSLLTEEEVTATGAPYKPFRNDDTKTGCIWISGNVSDMGPVLELSTTCDASQVESLQGFNSAPLVGGPEGSTVQRIGSSVRMRALKKQCALMLNGIDTKEDAQLAAFKAAVERF